MPSERPRQLVRDLVLAPAADVWNGLERSLEVGARGLPLVMLGLLAGWWLYVPLHELLHAFACWLAGGSVTRLEIDALYGGALLARLLPFVAAGSDYAGRLSDFDTGGSDAVYLATDLGPFLLTLFPGVWALRRASGALGFGFWLPFALAPFLSLTGDAYEIGSILITRLPPWSAPETAELLRHDDVFLLASELAKTPAAPWAGAALAFALGTVWAFATYAAGGFLASRIKR